MPHRQCRLVMASVYFIFIEQYRIATYQQHFSKTMRFRRSFSLANLKQYDIHDIIY